MRYFKGSISSDELCGIIIEALKSGPKSSRELFSICKERYAEFWQQKYSIKKAIVSDGEIRYRLTRLLKEGLIIRDSNRNYSLS